MIKITYGNNLNRNSKIVDAGMTLREFLDDVGMDYARGGIMVDGGSLRPGDLDKTFAEFGIRESASVLNVAKADNG